jgi:hypothetical protein
VRQSSRYSTGTTIRRNRRGFDPELHDRLGDGHLLVGRRDPAELLDLLADDRDAPLAERLVGRCRLARHRHRSLSLLALGIIPFLAVLANIISDYISLFLVRYFLGVGRSRPFVSSLLAPLVGAFIVVTVF